MGILQYLQKLQAKQLSQRGHVLLDSSHFREALPLFMQELAIHQALGNHRAEVDALRILGGIHVALSNYLEAIAYGQQAADLAIHTNDPEGESMAKSLLGNCYLATGDYQKALTNFEDRLIVAKQFQDHYGESAMLMNISSIYQGQGKYQDALDYLTQALLIIDTLPDHLNKITALDNMGRLHYLLGDYTLSTHYLQQSLSLAQKSLDRKALGNVLEDLGNVYFAKGDYNTALAYQQQSLQLMRDIGDQRGEATVLNGLGNIARAKGNYLQSIDYRQQQLTLSRKIGAQSIEALALGNLANIYQALGNFTSAETYQKQQLLITERTGDKHQQATCLGNLGNTYLKLKQYDQASECYHHYLKIAQEIQDPAAETAALSDLGSLAYERYDYEKAMKYWQQSLLMAKKISDSSLESLTISNIGLVYYAQGDYPQAIIHHQQALEIARQTGRTSEEGTALHNLGNAFLQHNQLPEAEHALTKAILVWEQIRVNLKEEDAYKISIFDQQTNTYQLLQYVLVTQGKIEEALEISERGRSQAFAELMAKGISSPNPQPIDLQSTRINIAQIRRIAQEQQATLVEYSFIATDTNDILTRPYPGGELFIWIISISGIITFEHVSITSLLQQLKTTSTNLITQVYTNLRVRRHIELSPDHEQTPFIDHDLQSLHQLLIQPILKSLPQNPEEQIIFVPQNFLFLVPFAALQDSEGHVLIEQHTLRLTPSLQILTLTQQMRQRNIPSPSINALIVGNPTMPEITIPGKGTCQLSELLNAEDEAYAISNLLHNIPEDTSTITNPFHVECMIGNQATKKAVLSQMSSAHLLHLATHGFLGDLRGFGIPGAIALAPSTHDDGWLTSEDILSLKLQADLVVLSACDTGQGQVTGDGVIGLSRSFLSAGTSSILVSLWAIPDAPTSYLMTEFYHSLLHSQDKAQALRHAMLKTRAWRPDPQDWAAFALMGETQFFSSG